MCEDYMYACQRAELLGEPKPNEEEWIANQKNTDDDDTDGVSTEVLQDIDGASESMGRIGGGLDELNSILSVTQKKINRFKTVCGSLGQLLKGRIGTREHDSDSEQETVEQTNTDNETNESRMLNDETLGTQELCNAASDNDNNQVHVTERMNDVSKSSNSKGFSGIKKHDINDKIESHIDKLDSLINKAENAQYSMQYQTKQMKKIIKK